MRMDPTTGPTAADVLNTYSSADLTRVLARYGEEFARKIIYAIVRAREVELFTTSARLLSCCTPRSRPARRTGDTRQAHLPGPRMEVNDELAVLRRAIPAAIAAIHGRPRGRRVPTTPWRTDWSSRRSPRL